MALYQGSQLLNEKTFLSRKDDGFFLLFSNLLACPAGATSDGTAPCACAANFQVNDANDACEGKSQTKSTKYLQLMNYN